MCSAAARAPLRGRRAARRRADGRSSRARRAAARLRSGSLRPRTSIVANSSASTTAPASRSTPWPIRIAPAGAFCCRRAAMLTASPVAKVDSLSSATTSPDSMPIRACRPSSSTVARTWRARARTARSASSSCAENGTPNAAITASPANFSTMPPRFDTQCETFSKKPLTRRRTISGSLAETSAVESTRSTNSTVASFRSTFRILRSPTAVRWRRRRFLAVSIPCAGDRPEGLQGVRRAGDLSGRARRGGRAGGRAGVRGRVRAATDRDRARYAALVADHGPGGDAGASEGGADVVDIGLVGTEMLYLRGRFELDLDGGIEVTASLN